MSASLVGSEMCIRDSLRVVAVGCSVCPGRSFRGRRYGARWPFGRGGAAVSYTHLTLPTICSV
eukprot:6775157-Alexandrium_andersonii.AAC.1